MESRRLLGRVGVALAGPGGAGCGVGKAEGTVLRGQRGRRFLPRRDAGWIHEVEQRR